MKATRATTISSSTEEAKVISWIILSQTSNYCLYPCLGCRRTLLDQISGPHSNPEVNGVAGTCCFCLRIRSQYLFEEGEFIQTLDLYTLDSEHQLLALDVMSMHISFWPACDLDASQNHDWVPNPWVKITPIIWKWSGILAWLWAVYPCLSFWSLCIRCILSCSYGCYRRLPVDVMLCNGSIYDSLEATFEGGPCNFNIMKSGCKFLYSWFSQNLSNICVLMIWQILSGKPKSSWGSRYKMLIPGSRIKPRQVKSSTFPAGRGVEKA